MIAFSLKTSDISKIRKNIDRYHADARKALRNAIRVQGFSLMHTLRQAILAGAPAPGYRFKDLSLIARTVNRMAGLRQPRPLQRLAGGITYVVDDQALTMRVGFTERSRPWAVAAARKQQKGFTRPVTWKMREWMAWRGTLRQMSRKKAGRRLGNPLLLKRTTTRFTIPARPIIGPFWSYQKLSSINRIRKNFRTIMSGRTAQGGVLIRESEMANW